MRLPQYGMGMADAEVVEWLKEVGDAVSEGEPVVVVDAAKTTVEVNAPASGTLAEQKYDVGGVAEVGDVLALIET